MGIIFALSYAILVSIGKLFLKKSHSNLPSSSTFFFESIFGIIIWGIFGITSGIKINEVLEIAPYVLLSAILSEAYIFYIYSKGNLSIIISVFSSYSIFTALFAFFILNERLSLEETVTISVLILGVILLSFHSEKLKRKERFISVLWALSGAIAVGFSDSISKDYIDQTSASTFLFVLGIIQIPVSLIYLKLEKQSIIKTIKFNKDFKVYKPALIAAFFIGLGQLFFWLSFENAKASIASPLTSSQIMISVLLGAFVLKEKLHKKDVFAIILISSAIITLGIIN